MDLQLVYLEGQRQCLFASFKLTNDVVNLLTFERPFQITPSQLVEESPVLFLVC